MADDRGLLLDFFRRFDDHDLPCFIGGSVAAMLFGEPRFTLDIDLVLAVLPEDAERIAACFDERFYVPPLDVMRREIARGSKGSFKIVDSEGLKADCYPAGEDALNRYGFATAIELDVDGLRVRAASPTYLCAMKLRWWAISQQDKHLRDIRGLLAISPELIDRAVVTQWATSSGTLAQWADCQARAGEE